MFCKIGVFLKFSKIVVDDNISVQNPWKIFYERVFKGVHQTAILIRQFLNGLPRGSRQTTNNNL